MRKVILLVVSVMRFHLPHTNQQETNCGLSSERIHLRVVRDSTPPGKWVSNSPVLVSYHAVADPEKGSCPLFSEIKIPKRHNKLHNLLGGDSKSFLGA